MLKINKDFDYYKNFFESLKKGQSYKRLGKTFENKKKYYYDLGTGKVLECEKNVFDILKSLEKYDLFDSILNLQIQKKQLLNALNIIECAVNKENIMKAPALIKMTGPHIEDLEYHINNKLDQLTLELTQRCNLKCKYCIYQDINRKFRSFKNDDMDFNTASKAINYAVKHSKRKNFYLTFYGGEPLLKFDLIKQCVKYLQSKNMNNNIFYSLTTNLTLLTKEKAEYFASIPNFTIVCSLDGDKEIHDQNRVTINNEGSFDLAIKGFENLLKAYGKERSTSIIINMVVTEPYTMEKFDSIQNFIDTSPYILPEMTIMYSYVDYGNNKNLYSDLKLIEKEEFEYWYPIQKWEREKNVIGKKLFTSSNTNRGFIKIHDRKLSNEPTGNYFFNGCCIPGGRKLYVTTKGNFHVCERMGQTPIIGNVNSGIDFKVVNEKFVEDYNRFSITDCKKCWAVKLCGLCYAHCYEKDGIDIRAKRYKCFHERKMIEYYLSEYHRVLEENPDTLEILNDMMRY